MLSQTSTLGTVLVFEPGTTTPLVSIPSSLGVVGFDMTGASLALGRYSDSEFPFGRVNRLVIGVSIVTTAAPAESGHADWVRAEHLQHLGYKPDDRVLEVGMPPRKVEHIELDPLADQRRFGTRLGISEVHPVERRERRYEASKVPSCTLCQDTATWQVMQKMLD